jgi:hypothetical protein
MTYKKLPLKDQGFFERLFGKQPKENAFIEVNNLLSDKSLQAVTIEDVQNILSKYKVCLYSAEQSRLGSLYSDYLRHCLTDKMLTEDEVDELAHLKAVLHLNDQTISHIHNQLASEIYKTEFDKVISNGRLDDQEKSFLAKLQKDLKLSDNLADTIRRESSSKLVNTFLNNSISDQRLSPDEEKELQTIAHSLGAELTMDAHTKSAMDKYKLFWQIENSEIPTIPVSLNLQKNERCYFYTTIDWLEQRSITKRINYSGPTLRIKIVKGVYWRAGSLGVQRITQDVWTTIDSGTLFLTNKKLIFMGSKGNKSIQLSKILDFTAYKNGIDIQKETGKSPFLQFENNVDIFAMMLGRAVSEI